MRINFNNNQILHSINNNNGSQNNKTLPFKLAKPSSEGVSLNLSSESVDQYFKNGVFKSPFDSVHGKNGISSKVSNNTNASLDRYGEIYAQIHEKIETFTTKDTKTDYLNKLDKSFEATIDEQADDMVRNIDELFRKYEMESPLDRDAFKKSFKEVATAIKNFHLENKPGKLSDYVEKHVNFSNYPDIKSYKAFSTVTDIVDLFHNVTTKAKQLQSIISTQDNSQIKSESSLNHMMGFANDIAKDMDLLAKLKDNLNSDELGEKFGKAFSKVVEKHSANLNDVSGKMTRYTEYMEKYQKLQKEIEQAIAKREVYNQKLDQANRAKEEKLVAMYLKSVASMDGTISTLKAQSAQVESEMASLMKDISSATI